MSPLQQVIQEFLRYMRTEKDASSETLAAYRSDLKPLEGFLRREQITPDPANLTTPVLRRYLMWVQEERNLSSSSLRRKIHCLRSFFRYLVEQEYITQDPMRKIRLPGFGKGNVYRCGHRNGTHPGIIKPLALVSFASPP
jgi:site-specific recombinase XerD